MAPPLASLRRPIRRRAAEPATPPPGEVAVEVPKVDLLPTGSLADSMWVPRNQLSAAQAATIPEFCDGAYRTFNYPYPAGSEADRYPLHAAADRASYTLQGDVELHGEVHLQQGNRVLAASQARLDHVTRIATVTGGVRLQEPGLAIQGQQGVVNLDTHAATIHDVEFVLLDSALRGTARTVAQDGKGDLAMRRGSFTRCEPGSGNWLITASSVDVQKGAVFGTARNAVVRVKHVPVFYAPYLRFPVSDARQSGWLFPTLAYSNEDGTDVTLPYYFNLAPNYDATLTPRYITKRGPGVEGEFRHLSSWEETALSAAFLYEDDLYNGTYSRQDFRKLEAAGQVGGDFVPENRWLYAMEHSGGFGNFSTRVDYAAVSDRDYFRDLGSDLGVSSAIELERRGQIEYATGGLLMRFWAQRFQRLDDIQVDPYQRLPELDLSYTGDLPGPLQWSVASSAVTFTRPNDDLTGLAAAVGDRIHVEPRINLPLAAAWGFLNLTGGYRYTEYHLRDVPDTVDTTPQRDIGLGIAHAGLNFERDVNFFDTHLVQTLEPQLYYLYQEYEPQNQLPEFDSTTLTFSFSQLFRDNRFAGLDRIGDANQLSIGLTTRLLDPTSGREYLRASAGVIDYFRDRRVTLSGPPGPTERQSTSSIAGELAAPLAGGWSASSSVIWNPHEEQWDEGAVALQYRGDNRHIVNLGYRKRLVDDIQQSDASLYWPVSDRYAVIGRWNYDFISGRTIEGFGGIEYNDCCWQIRLMVRHFLNSPTGRNLDTVESDEGVLLQIVFKGLAGFGDQMESVLQRGIRGYRTETMNVH